MTSKNPKGMAFTKMVGAGNDFLVIEARKGVNYRALAPKMCHRTEGIGADGLLLLADSKKADYRMRIINADGSEAEMCGNGARCLAAYIARHHNPKNKLFSLETLAGIIKGEAKGEVARVRLSDPAGYTAGIPLTVQGQKIHVHYIDTGVPHAIVYVNDLDHIDVAGIGTHIRHHKHFAPRGTNVNFVEQIKPGLIAARTYERGVEDETRACGTGSVAAALVSYRLANPLTSTQKKAQIQTQTRSGEILQITFDLENEQMTNVWLKGSARFIGEGLFYQK